VVYIWSASPSFNREHYSWLRYKGAEGTVRGGLDGAIFSPFVGPEAMPIGVAGGAAGLHRGCFESALGIQVQ
jgi:hypothetical protein